MASSERISAKKRVIELVARECGYQPDELDEDTDLYRDLNVIGDDVDDLFVALSKEFDLPLDEIDVRGCFPGEPHLFSLFSDLFFRPKRRIRIRHLIDAVLTKRWPELEEGVTREGHRGRSGRS